MYRLGFFVVGITFIASLVQPAIAAEFGTVGIKPAFPRADNPRTQSIFVHTIEPGQSVEDGVVVVNNSSVEKTVILYATDSTPSSDGAFACEQLVEEKNDVGKWLVLEKNELTIPAISQETVKFKIDVPLDAPVGENNGCILVQEKSAEPESLGSGVQLSVRSGTRVALTVPGDIRKDIEILALEVMKNEKGVTILHPSVKNSGNVSMDTDITVVTRYWTGWKFFQHGGQYPIFAGRTSEWNFELPKSFWGGLMISRVYASYDPRVDIEIGKEDQFQKVTEKGPFKVYWLWPTVWAWVLDFLILAAIAGLGFLLWLKKKQLAWMKMGWKEYTVKKGDDLTSLSHRFDVAWHLIAAKNKLKAPYILQPGTVIFVPDPSAKPEVAKPKRHFAFWPKSAKPTKATHVSSVPKKIKVPNLITVVAEKGDKLKDIADYAGITVPELARLNKIKSVRSYKVKSGQEFIIPNPDK